MLELKLENAESKALKAYVDKKIEVEALKSSLKNSGLEVMKLKKDLEYERKSVKQKDKVIQKLEHKCENLTTSNMNVKTEKNKLKNENKKLLKNLPNKLIINKDSIDSNQNLQPAVSTETCSSSLTQPGAHLGTQPGTPTPA